MSHALIALSPAAIEEDRLAACAISRPSADFVAHLIATSAKLPQTRERRRAEPEQAVAVYAALSQRSTRSGRALSRSL
jgi:hypothetical protein